MPARAVCSGKVIEGAAGLLPLPSQATFSEMIRRVVKYGHPVLRQKGGRVGSITRSVRQLIEDLIETMYASKGIGLAAQQIGEALQVTVLDVRQMMIKKAFSVFSGAASAEAKSNPANTIASGVTSL